MKIVLTFLFFITLTSLAHSQNYYEKVDSVYWIDKLHDECMDKNPSTMGMIQCIDHSDSLWDAEMNKYYNLLMSKLHETGKSALRDAQRKWIEYRDAEYKEIESFYEFIYEKMGGGTMYPLLAAASKMEVNKKRALELIGKYGALQDFIGDE